MVYEKQETKRHDFGSAYSFRGLIRGRRTLNDVAGTAGLERLVFCAWMSARMKAIAVPGPGLVLVFGISFSRPFRRSRCISVQSSYGLFMLRSYTRFPVSHHFGFFGHCQRDICADWNTQSGWVGGKLTRPASAAQPSPCLIPKKLAQARRLWWRSPENCERRGCSWPRASWKCEDDNRKRERESRVPREKRRADLWWWMCSLWGCVGVRCGCGRGCGRACP